MFSTTARQRGLQEVSKYWLKLNCVLSQHQPEIEIDLRYTCQHCFGFVVGLAFSKDLDWDFQKTHLRSFWFCCIVCCWTGILKRCTFGRFGSVGLGFLKGNHLPRSSESTFRTLGATPLQPAATAGKRVLSNSKRKLSNADTARNIS